MCRVIKHVSIGVCVFVVLCGVFEHVFYSGVCVFVFVVMCGVSANTVTECHLKMIEGDGVVSTKRQGPSGRIGKK